MKEDKIILMRKGKVYQLVPRKAGGAWICHSCDLSGLDHASECKWIPDRDVCPNKNFYWKEVVL